MKKERIFKRFAHKTLISAVLAALTVSLLISAFLLLPGCTPDAGGGKIHVLATVFPLYDWTREVAKGVEGVEIDLLADNGADIHSYVPGVSDIAAISSCDIIVYTGGESDAWVRDAVAKVPADGKKPVEIVISAVPGVTLLDEEIREGMEVPAEEHAHGDEEEFDEHLWLSFGNAKAAVNAIASALSEADPGNAEKYSSNAEAYKGALEALKGKYADTVAAADTKVLFFGDRFPFLYLTREFGLDYYAPFTGCSAETEVSPATIVFLKGKAAELGISKVIVLPGSSRKIADTVMSETAHAGDYTLLTLDPMQQAPAKDAENATYLAVMEANLKVIAEALKKN